MTLTLGAPRTWAFDRIGVHQKITLSAIFGGSLASHQYEPIKCALLSHPDVSIGFSLEAYREIKSANVLVDDVQGVPHLHFDDESLRDGSKRLIEAKKRLVDILLSKSDGGPTARRVLGAALHTLQDFYSHTNYVENSLQNSAPIILTDLGRAVLSQPSPSTVVGDGQNVLPGAPLTSGYVPDSKWDYVLCGWEAPSKIKAVHGPFTCGEGLHKDVPHRQGHYEAVNAAIVATQDFINQVFEAIDDRYSRGQISHFERDDAICRLMGITDESEEYCCPEEGCPIEKAWGDGPNSIPFYIPMTYTGTATCSYRIPPPDEDSYPEDYSINVPYSFVLSTAVYTGVLVRYRGHVMEFDCAGMQFRDGNLTGPLHKIDLKSGTYTASGYSSPFPWHAMGCNNFCPSAPLGQSFTGCGATDSYVTGSGSFSEMPWVEAYNWQNYADVYHYLDSTLSRYGPCEYPPPKPPEIP